MSENLAQYIAYEKGYLKHKNNQIIDTTNDKVYNDFSEWLSICFKYSVEEYNKAVSKYNIKERGIK